MDNLTLTTYTIYILCENINVFKGPGGSMSWVVGLPSNSYWQAYHQDGVGSRPTL
jgi:hypothetical protein